MLCKLHNGVEIKLLVKVLFLVLFIAIKAIKITIKNLNKSLYQECMKYGFCFSDNGVISQKDLWKDGIHQLENGRVIVANNLIN